MTTEQGLAFLQAHQPMPDDQDLSEALIREYDEVRQFFMAHPDPRCIPLFLTSFGAGDGFGVYQLVEDVVRPFSRETVVPYLQHGLAHPQRSIRYWNAEIAAHFPSPALLELLGKLLTEDDADMRSAAAIALGQIEDARVEALLQHAFANERKTQLAMLLHKLLSNTTARVGASKGHT